MFRKTVDAFKKSREKCLRLRKPFAKRKFGTSAKSTKAMELESKYNAHNYHPIPVVLARGKGVYVFDVDDKRYMDFLSAYSAVNQGHCHPKIVKTLQEQAEQLTLCSRAFYNDTLGKYAEFVTGYFGYDAILPMNTGVEACESAVKIARKWGHYVKGIENNTARVCFVRDNFWGRTISAVSASNDPESYDGYGPFTPGFDLIDYGNAEQLEAYFAQNGPQVAAFMCEPIQGEAGVVIPPAGYLRKVRELCTQYNVLMIADEVQTGLGRTGTTLCVDYDGVKPDLITMGKALSGGMLPVSVVVGIKEAMDVLKPGTHGSTYGGNPLACKVAMTALEVLRDEGMVENSKKMGERLLAGLKEIEASRDIVLTTRGRGLFCAMEIMNTGSVNAWNVCIALRDRGLLAKPTHDNIIRFSPPLVINEQQVDEAIQIIDDAVASL